MKISFKGLPEELSKAAEILLPRIGLELSPKGLPVDVLRSEKASLRVCFDGVAARVEFKERIHFFRALGLLAEAIRERRPCEMEERSRFSLNSALLDASNNAVPSVATVKSFIETMALMGLNGLMLYAKDTYEVDGYPYFGHMRGAFTREELRDCDEYANLFGIEMIPCVQALAHLDMALKWSFASDVKDNPDILLVGEEKTYKLLEAMLASISAPFRSKRIHLGMDEAHGLGLGRYLELHGFRNRFDIMSEHLERLRGICSKLGLQPMMWSDMYFRLASARHDYYDMDASVPQDVIDKMPDGLQMVFWDYYHDDEASYRHFLKEHKKFKAEPLFAGGVWLWKGLMPDYRKTFSSTNAALAACKAEGIREVVATVWHDNGAETNYFYSLLGLQLFAEHGYSDAPSMERVRKRFSVCAGASAEPFEALSSFDYPDGFDGKNYANPSKYALWQDPLCGLFDLDLDGLAGHYARLEKSLKTISKKAGRLSWLMAFPVALAEALSMKVSLVEALSLAYKSGDKAELERIASKSLPELGRKLGRLRRLHREQWMRTCKPFGWEVLDIRYGGLLARIESSAARLKDYLSGKISRIEELEAKRLPFSGEARPCCNRYHRIATAGYLSGNFIQY